VTNLLRVVVAVMLLACVASTTATAIVSVGDPWSGNSWGQRFDHQALRDFEVLRLDWIFGSEFEVPTVFEGFGDDAWTASSENPTFASAFGSRQHDLEFDIVFSGDIRPTAFTFTTYCDGDAEQYFTAECEEGPNESHRWRFDEHDHHDAPSCPRDNPEPPSVPDPATIMLLGAGLTILAGAKLRKRSR
jgi:hypothetical protein